MWKTKLSLPALALGACAACAVIGGLALSAAAQTKVGEGEECGSVRMWFYRWEADCDAGLSCEVNERGWWGERGVCVAPDDECDSDAECQAGLVCSGEPRRCVPDVNPGSDTEQSLNAFFDLHGGRAAFPDSYVDGVETMLRAEDDVMAGDYRTARARLDAVFERYPLSDPAWRNGAGRFGTNVGSPVAYYGLRILDEIVRVGLSNPPPSVGTLKLGVAMPSCATGTQPVDTELTQPGKQVSLALSEAVVADDHRIIRQSLRLFHKYLWALTGGRFTVEPSFHHVDMCAEVHFRSEPHNYAGLRRAADVIAAIPAETQDDVDMWWVLYPSNVPSDPMFDDHAFITGGMGAYGRKPMLIIDDLWLVRKPPHLGSGPYTDVERRAYLPQWLQHEFFHHFFKLYPEFGLEDKGHQWFDRSTWPDDFVGSWEPDYYAEAFTKRIANADVPLWSYLHSRLDPDVVAQVRPEDLTGDFRRLPMTNDWHEVTVTLTDAGLWWTNAADHSWSLHFENGRLRTGPDCPYGVLDMTLELARDEHGNQLPVVTGLWSGSELYTRRSAD